MITRNEIKLRKQDELRKRVKLLKALQGFPYSEIAEYLNIKQSSVYSWLNRQYNFSTEKAELLGSIIDDLTE